MDAYRNLTDDNQPFAAGREPAYVAVRLTL